MGAELAVLISIATIIGSGISVYVGLRVTQAEERKDIIRLTQAIKELAEQHQKDYGNITIQHEKDYDRISKRLDRIEDPYFKPK